MTTKSLNVLLAIMKAQMTLRPRVDPPLTPLP